MKVNYLAVGASVAAFALLAFILLVPNVRGMAATANPNLPANCYHDVGVTNAVPPNISKADYKPNVESNALVTVGANGKPITAKTVKSSGSAAIDRATIDAAMQSGYSPEVSNCKPKTGSYLFHVETGPPQP
ncbi:MAG: energy transducer TonB [Candidatus Eremiobacteraeota bacterium]|nr:energy transducer TonB [Candidatus Eremiobacteraeota bacterium]